MQLSYQNKNLMNETFQIIIKGQVQGVGFRPFVYALATSLNLKGTVSNNSEGVIIFITGNHSDIYQFYNKLIQHPPPVAKISNHAILKIKLTEYKDFSIVPSSKNSKLNLTLTPDFAICDDCSTDIQSNKNRRYNYPFTTCVNCGPRWAITQSFPFERLNTSIHDFLMCEDCLEEYSNPTNRRFHSQTNSCPICGFKITFTNSTNKILSSDNNSVFDDLAQVLSEGKIVAIKNTSGYLLCCDARNEKTISELRYRKKRPKKPFAVLYPSLELLKKEVVITEKEQQYLTSTERPIVIVSTNDYNGNIALNSIAPQLKQLGVMMPYSALLQLITSKLSFPIVATSGNIHGSPIISDELDAITKLSSVADYFLHHNLKILHPQDDSVIKISTKFEKEILFRRSRGYAPNYFNFNYSTNKKVLATGAHLKSSIAFVPNDYLYLSQYLGNLDNYEVTERYHNTLDNFISLFEEQPDLVLTDSHPQYQSTRIAHELSHKYHLPIFEIQHHKAHFMSVIGEHELVNCNEKILGVIWDGTGFGDDHQIWGSEFFIYNNSEIERISYINYVNWFAGDKMAKEPRLSLLSFMTEEMTSVVKEKFTDQEWNIYTKIKNNNTLKTSSMGRLFDALASLLNLVDYNTYEGEAAIVLENHVETYDLNACKDYHVYFNNNNINGQEILLNCYIDLKKGEKVSVIIANFLYTLSLLVFKVAHQHQTKNIAFSGGVFQNTTLVDMITALATNQYNLYFNKQMAPNDENIAFGQLMYYYHILKP